MRCLYLTSSSRYSPWLHLDVWSCSGQRFTKTVVCIRFIAIPKLKLQNKQRPGRSPIHWNPIQGRPLDWAELRRLFGSRPFHEVLNFTPVLAPTRSEKRSTGTRQRRGIVFVRPSQWRSRCVAGTTGRVVVAMALLHAWE
jgi:hypothetical protein